MRSQLILKRSTMHQRIIKVNIFLFSRSQLFDTGVDDREVFGAWEKGSTCDRSRLIKMLDVHNLPLDMMCLWLNSCCSRRCWSSCSLCCCRLTDSIEPSTLPASLPQSFSLMVPVMCRKLQMQARSHYPWCSCNFNKSKLSILAGTLTALKVLMWPATQWIRTAWSKTSATVLNLKSRLAFLMGNDDDNVMMILMWWWWWRCDDDNDVIMMTMMWWWWQCDANDNVTMMTIW